MPELSVSSAGAHVSTTPRNTYADDLEMVDAKTQYSRNETAGGQMRASNHVRVGDVISGPKNYFASGGIANPIAPIVGALNCVAVRWKKRATSLSKNDYV